MHSKNDNLAVDALRFLSACIQTKLAVEALRLLNACIQTI